MTLALVILLALGTAGVLFLLFAFVSHPLRAAHVHCFRCGLPVYYPSTLAMHRETTCPAKGKSMLDGFLESSLDELKKRGQKP